MDAHTGARTVLLTGATGYIGGRLLPVLLEEGHRVRCLVRDRAKARLPDGVEVVEGDVVKGTGLAAALDGVDVAYYLVHAMGRGNGASAGFAERDRGAARALRPRRARRAGRADDLPRRPGGRRRAVRAPALAPRGGRGPARPRARARLRARRDGHRRGQRLLPDPPPPRPALPAMLTPRWVDTRSQPIAIRDVVQALATLATLDDPPAEVQLGGADVLTWRQMMQRYAEVSGRRAPAIVKVPVLSPRLSSYWVSAFTPVEADLVRPLVDGMSAETVVRRPPPPGINDHP
jgi:uncharacterized protein YbjT (DUF2867 family)